MRVLCRNLVPGSISGGLGTPGNLLRERSLNVSPQHSIARLVQVLSVLLQSYVMRLHIKVGHSSS